jgi:quinol monooxygenase YgiN
MSDASVELTVVTMAFDAVNAGAGVSLAAILSHYVVVARGESGCRNVDLCASISATGRFVILQKWDSPTAQRAHFDGPAMVTMASACHGLLARAPEIELLEPISAHDLR